MADAVSDSLLRKQLLEFGAENIGPINEKNRYLYIKKLNHLRAKRRSSLSLGKSSRGLSGFSSDEDNFNDGRNQRKASPAADSKRQKKVPQNRRRSQVSTPTASQENGSALLSSLARPRLRSRSTFKNGFDSDCSMNESLKPEPQMQSFTAQTSFASDNSLFNDSSVKQVGNDSCDTANHSSWFSGESSDSDSAASRSRDASRHRKQKKSAVLPLTSCSLDHKYNSLRYSPKGKIKVQPEVVAPKHPFISMLLLIFMALFFISLAAFYFNIAVPTSDGSQANNFMYCPGESASTSASTPKPGCFKKHEVEAVLPIVNHLIFHLSEIAGQHECGSLTSSPNLTVQECIAVMNAHFREAGEEDCSRNRMNVSLQLFAKNPHWNVRLSDQFGSVLGEDTDLGYVQYLWSADPNMSFLCRLGKSLKKIMNIVLISLALILTVSMAVTCVKIYWKRKEEQTRQLYALVEQVLDKVRNHHDAYHKAQETGRKDILPYIAVTHVRDMLIPPQDRKKKLNLWREVVKFIDANESRIRAEEQCIEDEEFIVWRWLQNTANGRKRKVWQGQAFGAKESSNMPAFRPTKCLKIRNMFDAEVEYGEDWHVHIQDAILEKCGPDHSIVHMAVDKSSKEGCVFVMCASSEASGRAFHALHGWWFDGILITVKFLRLERYYERFPDAIGCTQPLIPSNSEGNSLSVPFHQSITESS